MEGEDNYDKFADCPFCDRCVLPKNMRRHQRSQYCRQVYEHRLLQSQEKIDIDNEDNFIGQMTKREQLEYFGKLTEEEYDAYIWRRAVYK